MNRNGLRLTHIILVVGLLGAVVYAAIGMSVGVSRASDLPTEPCTAPHLDGPVFIFLPYVANEGDGGDGTQEPTTTCTPEASATDTEEASATDTEEASATDTEEASPTDTEEASPTDTEEASATDTEEVSPTDTEEALATNTPPLNDAAIVGILDGAGFDSEDQPFTDITFSNTGSVDALNTTITAITVTVLEGSPGASLDFNHAETPGFALGDLFAEGNNAVTVRFFFTLTGTVTHFSLMESGTYQTNVQNTFTTAQDVLLDEQGDPAIEAMGTANLNRDHRPAGRRQVGLATSTCVPPQPAGPVFLYLPVVANSTDGSAAGTPVPPIATCTPGAPATDTQVPTETNSPSQTATNTPTSTTTNTPTATGTPSPTASNTPSQTPTNTPTSTATYTPTATGTPTATKTPSPTATNTTATATATATPTATNTPPLGNANIIGIVNGAGFDSVGKPFADVTFQNTGSVDAHNTLITDVTVTVLGGSPGATLQFDFAVNPGLTLGDLFAHANNEVTVRFYFKMTGTVTHFSLAESGTYQTNVQNQFSISQEVFFDQ